MLAWMAASSRAQATQPPGPPLCPTPCIYVDRIVACVVVWFVWERKERKEAKRQAAQALERAQSRTEARTRARARRLPR